MSMSLLLLLVALMLTVNPLEAQQVINSNEVFPETPPTMLMTTDMPEGIATPNVVETASIGTLTSFDGVPDLETTQKLFDNLDLQRATQAFLNTLQISSLSAMKHGLTQFGPATTTALLFEDLVDSKSLLLTANTVSVYMMMWMEVPENEPMVLETPPNVLGFINDAWFQYVIDFGNAGPDNGMGGKFLIVPPGYTGDLPAESEGYHVANTNTYGHWVVWRGFQVDGSTEQAISATKEMFKMYPLSMKDNSPPELNFVNASGEFFNTVHRMDFGFWNELNDVIQAEPILEGQGLDAELRGQLASIGIEKGKEFAPDERMTRILTEAANVGSVTARALAARPRDARQYFYPGESVWMTAFVDGRYDFLLNGARLLDSRAFFHFYATGITPAMAAKNVGTGSQYEMTFVDKDGKALDGSMTYRINLPKDVPAKDFWSFTLYDNQSRSMLQTDQRFPGLSSVDANPPVANADGSYDVYFGPTPPDGKEQNWIQTVPGKGWNIIFRLYGPLESFYDKTWKPGDPELIVVDSVPVVVLTAKEEEEAKSLSSSSSFPNQRYSLASIVMVTVATVTPVLCFL